jgi:hypothetical protein
MRQMWVCGVALASRDVCVFSFFLALLLGGAQEKEEAQAPMMDKVVKWFPRPQLMCRYCLHVRG